MLSRFVSKSSHFNHLTTLIFSRTHHVITKPISQSPLFSNPTNYFGRKTPHFYFFSTDGKNGNFGDNDDSANSTIDLWKLSSDIDKDVDSVFSVESETLEGNQDENGRNRIGDPFGGVDERGFGDGGDGGLFDSVEENSASGGNEGPHWSLTEEGNQHGGGNEASVASETWSFMEENQQDEEHVFGVEEEGEGNELGNFNGKVENGVKSEEAIQLEAEETALTAVLKGPNRAFGDLIASSGITDEMLDSLIALKDFKGIKGLPPLSEIENQRYARGTQKSIRYELERQKQEEVEKSRVRQVDEKGQAYGTGRRKCSIARVWISPGDGKFVVNDKEFDVYFPMLDQRAALLRPFSETKTLGMWDVNCTVKGGGTTGQVGAVRLGISRALQNWEPAFRPPLKEAGFLTRDSRIVERKKPGKAKARKSFQWVKR